MKSFIDTYHPTKGSVGHFCNNRVSDNAYLAASLQTKRRHY